MGRQSPSVDVRAAAGYPFFAMRWVARALSVLIVIGVLAVGGGYVWIEQTANTSRDPTAVERPVEFRVQKGATPNQLGRELEAEKLISSALVWKVYVRLHGGGTPKAGRHMLHAGMTIPELIKALGETPLSDDIPLTMVEGWRLVDADEILSAAGAFKSGEYLRAAQNPQRFQIPFPFEGKTLEGYLYPETYMVPPGPVDVEKLIQRQLEKFHEKFYLPHRQEIEASGRTLHQLTILASMLEREEPVPALRPKVAGVMYNRLNSNTPLGIDATSRYLLPQWNDRKAFIKNLENPNEPYNTRKKAGLPPGPIGAPSLPSLLAALRPEKSQYWYYLHDSNRQIHFSRTAAEHEAKRTKYNVR
jgi:UPF0755 protein